jgi:tetratricopeptide (TPR) repeat protein
MTEKKIALFLLLVLAAAFGSALDFSLRPRGFVLFPLGAGSKTAAGEERYSAGGGGDLVFEVDLASVLPNPLGLGYTLGLEGGIAFNPVKSAGSDNLSLYSGGGSLGLYYFPLSRLFTRLDGGLGISTGVLGGGRTPLALWWRFGGEAGFRFTPGFILSAAGGYRSWQNGDGGALYSGLYVGLSLQLSFETGGGAGDGASIDFNQAEGVYPVFLSLYQRSPAGTLTITNHENAEVRDLRVSFRAAGYTASEFPCGTLPLLAKGRSATLPLYADFSPEILRFTGDGRILGEVVIRYRFLGQEKQSVQTVPVQVFSRNRFPPADRAGLAAFVSTASPEILEYAKHITGLARTNRRSGLNQNMQFAMWLFEGLLNGGIRLDASHTVPGEVQYPAETLGFTTGTNADIGLLYAAALEASGIPAAIIPTGMTGTGEAEEFIVACNLRVDQSQAELLFDGLDRVLVIDDQVWLPLSMNAFNEGFMQSWLDGVDALNAAFAAGMEVDFIMLESAWGTYPSAPLPVQGGVSLRTGEAELSRRVNQVLARYISQELDPLIRAIQGTLRSDPAAASYNRLGILLTRAGRLAEAKTAYERAAAMGSVPAMNNRGNLALTERDYPGAERWFRQTLTADPENQTALRGLETVRSDRDL